jgi:NADPH-dependent glutamate synthase beta subunit-like oxidoreductase
MTAQRPFAITLDVATSRANHTGTWRTERPEYVHRRAPCGGACPAGEDPQAWLAAAEEGDYERAWRIIMEDNPFPAVMGRVCYHPCQTACNRAQLDEAVGINAVERFLGDAAIEHGWTVDPLRPPTGRSVLVIGAGPSGLSAAYHLARLGHTVTVRDAGPAAGGMMRFGIPRYRLPRDVLDAEIARIAALGVDISLDDHVEDAAEAMRQGWHDAVFVAVGAHLARHTEIPAGGAAHVLDAVALLRDAEGGEPPRLGRRVVVYGGGDTAMDAARTARRLGADEAVVVYRRTRERMPAHDEEVQEAVEEGVLMRWLSTVEHVDDGRVVVERMELDEDGFPRGTGELEELAADALILALGQRSDLKLLEQVDGIVIRDGMVQVDEHLRTGHDGIFCGGDMVPAERTVTTAIGHGRHAARSIDAWLRLTVPGPDPREALEPAPFEGLNPWYFSDAPHQVRERLEATRRSSTFDEVVLGFDADTALFEARRCLSCGTCFACDNCFGMCPDNAVIQIEPGTSYAYAIDLDYCKGCGICARECPAGAIRMVPEEI